MVIMTRAIIDVVIIKKVAIFEQYETLIYY